ncbi:uncharacterized protein METZ01_LOCUS466413 [marine metagenome]|uniref:Nudix hydrolase domain-containing protein n=1 Tax=marine metagenome TaxID=408172 RepID=A0A383B1A9_9ZZZZ
MTKRDLQKWETLQKKDVFVAEPWIKVATLQVRLPDGRVVDDYHQIELGDYAVVYALTEDGSVIVERQYKHGIGKVTLVMPAGRIEPGEAPLEAAQRELLEETGYSADRWDLLGNFAINGNYGCGNAHIFMAQGARLVTEADSGDLEEIEVLLMDPVELTKSVRKGGIDLLGTAATVALATNHLIGMGIAGDAQNAE